MTPTSPVPQPAGLIRKRLPAPVHFSPPYPNVTVKGWFALATFSSVSTQR